MKTKAILATYSLLVATNSAALSLKEAVDLAVDFNPNLKSLIATVDSNDARLKQSMGAYQPAIKFKVDKGQGNCINPKR